MKKTKARIEVEEDLQDDEVNDIGADDIMPTRPARKKMYAQEVYSCTLSFRSNHFMEEDECELFYVSSVPVRLYEGDDEMCDLFFFVPKPQSAPSYF
jgi:hypothetical protein